MASCNGLSVGVVLAGLLAAAPALAESGVDAELRAAAACISRISGGQFPDPIRPGELQPPAADDSTGLSIAKSGDSTLRLPSSEGKVYVVEPKRQCAADSFNLDGKRMSDRIGPLLQGAPYNAVPVPGPFPEIPKVKDFRMWSLKTPKGGVVVIFGKTEDPTGLRVTVLVEPE